MNVEGSRTGRATISAARERVPAFLPGNLIGGALGPTAVAADACRSDEAGGEKAADGVVERAALEHQDLVPMTLEQQALHFVGMHGALAQETEDGEVP